MIERSVILWKIPADQIPRNPGDLQVLNIDYQSMPLLLEHLGADRQIVSHTLQRQADGCYLMSMFVERTA